MKKLNSTSNNKFKELRQQNNLTQLEFAKLLGVSRSHISNVEKGREKLSKPIIKLLSMIYGIDESLLVDAEETNKIKALRDDNNLTQLEFAEMLGLTESEIQKFETGTEVPLKPIIKLMALQFGVDESYFTDASGGSDVEPTNKIKVLREENKLTQIEFAEMLGITEKELNDIENDIVKPTKQTIKLIALQFGIAESSLCDALEV